jgi:hypothetical protein
MTSSAVGITADLIQRLQKVRALTDSSVPGEAAAAAAKLQEILLKYNLEMEDIEEDSPVPDDKYVKEELELGVTSGNMINWRRILLSGIARSLMCAAFGYQGTRQMVIVGQRHNIEMSRHFYDYLSSEIDRLADATWMKARNRSREHARSWKSSFYNGAVDIVVQRLEEKYQQVSKQDSHTQALVLKNERDLDDAVGNLIGRVRKNTVRQRHSKAGYNRGVRAGKRVNLDRPVDRDGRANRLRGS